MTCTLNRFPNAYSTRCRRTAKFLAGGRACSVACKKSAIRLALTVLFLAGIAGIPSQAQEAAGAGASLDRSFNPDLSAGVDVFYHADDSEEGISHVLEEVRGFGQADGEEDRAHDHGGIEEGFNLRHVEVQLAATVDPYIRASTIAAIDQDDAEVETAEIETTCLPWGLTLRGGKFYSDFGYINAQHAHQWDFADQPLIYQLTLGDHGLNEPGMQLSWRAPTPFFLLAGVEAFQGDNERMFAYEGEDPLPAHDGPRLGVAWLKGSPNLHGNHALQTGVFGASGIHQEARDGDANGADDHWMDGDSAFWGADAVYTYIAPHARGKGDVVVQAEYFSRRRDLEVVAHDLAPALVGTSRIDQQDGYYVQAVYGFLPRWRGGMRWEQVGLSNDTREPEGTRQTDDPSARAGVMVDFTPSAFSRVRLQANRGSYETDEGAVAVTEVYVQWVVSLGSHAAYDHREACGGCGAH